MFSRYKMSLFFHLIYLGEFLGDVSLLERSKIREKDYASFLVNFENQI